MFLPSITMPFLVLAGVSFSLAACTDAPRGNAPPRTSEPARVSEPSRASEPRPLCAVTAEAVSAAAQRPVSRDNARDLEGVVAAYTDDAVWMPPTGDFVTGKEAIRARYRTLFLDYAIQISSEVVEARAEGGLAYARGYTLGVLKPERGGTPVPVSDKFVAVLRCEGAKWRISHLMWSPRGATP